MARITLTSVCKSFGALAAVRDVNLDIADREFIVFVGPSGCGKSTLLRLIAGLESPDSGAVKIDGEDVTNVPPSKRGLSMVFQSYALYPHMSVRDNMAFGLKMAKTPPAEIERKVRDAAEMLHLRDSLHKKPGQLSGGQRQRVAIGRAVVREPRGFLFDEPLSNLDASLRVQTRLKIVRLQQKLGTTAIYVTHDQVEAMTMATRIAVLNNGAVEQTGAPMEIYRRPANMFVAGFIGSPKMNLIRGKEAAKHGAAVVGVRPEHLSLAASEDGGGWRGEVEIAEHLGADIFVYVQTAVAGRLTVRVGDGEFPRRGDRVIVAPDLRHLHRFAEDGRTMTDADAENPPAY
ncbi:MAG: ABC transporter ATP-binding protein [Gammaproteobacteria bacterium]